MPIPFLIAGLVAILGAGAIWYILSKFIFYIILAAAFFIFLFIYQIFDRIKQFEGLTAIIIGLIAGLLSYIALKSQSVVTITILAVLALGLFLFVAMFPRIKLK